MKISEDWEKLVNEVKMGYIRVWLIEHSCSDNIRLFINNLWGTWPSMSIIQLEDSMENSSPISVGVINDTVLQKLVIHVQFNLLVMIVIGQQNVSITQELLMCSSFQEWMPQAKQKGQYRNISMKPSGFLGWELKFYRIWV